MESIRVCMSNLWALQERRYAVVYVAVTKFVRTMLRLILLTTPRYFWLYGGSTKFYKLATKAATTSYFLLPSFRRSRIYRNLRSDPVSTLRSLPGKHRSSLIMRHLEATSVVQLSPENEVTLKPSYPGYSSRIILRHAIVLVILLLVASYFVGIILNPLYTMQGLNSTIQESVSQLNTTVKPSGLNFMDGKKVILVSHELSLSGGPLLLMELGTMLRRSGAHVFWVTGNEKGTTSDPVVVSLEKRLLNYGLQVITARGLRTITAFTMADLVILNTAVAGKWIDIILKGDAKKVLAKTLWWIHEMRGHYFAMEYVKHLPEVAGVMIDSHATAEYWRTRTRERLRITLPKIHVVHLGNSQQLMLAAEDAVGRASLRQRVRLMVGIHDNDVVFAMINSVSRGKGQDLFLRAFVEGVNLVKRINLVQKTVFTVHALLVGSDWAAPSYESMLRKFVKENALESTVHFVNKSLDVVPYLAASDILVQNSQLGPNEACSTVIMEINWPLNYRKKCWQLYFTVLHSIQYAPLQLNKVQFVPKGRGECFGRITIEAMAFQLPVLGTAAGGTLEIVVNGSTGRLHPVGKDGVHVLAQNIRDLTFDKSLRIRMGSRGYARVKQKFMEHHMCERLGLVLQTVLS